MARPVIRKPSRAQVLRSLAELAQLWEKPPDPGRETAPGQTEAADRESSETSESYAPGPRRARGIR